MSIFLANLEIWHAHMGHPNFSVVCHLLRQFQLPYSPKSYFPTNYHACCLGKMHCSSLPPTNNRSTKPLDLIDSDVRGPASINSSTGDKYFIIFIDDFSLFTWLFPIKNKSDVPNIFLQFQALVEK